MNKIRFDTANFEVSQSRISMQDKDNSKDVIDPEQVKAELLAPHAKRNDDEYNSSSTEDEDEGSEPEDHHSNQSHSHQRARSKKGCCRFSVRKCLSLFTSCMSCCNSSKNREGEHGKAFQYKYNWQRNYPVKILSTQLSN